MDDKNIKENKDEKKKIFSRKATKKLISNVNIYKRNLMEEETCNDYMKTEQKSKKFYDKFVNGFKKTNKNEENKEGNKYMNIEKMMMDQIIIKEENNYHTIKVPIKNEIDDNIPSIFNFSDNDKDIENLKYIQLIQRNYKIYKNKKASYEKLIDEKEIYLPINDMKKLNKEKLEIELIKSFNKNKELINIIKYYRNKLNLFELENNRFREKINPKHIQSITKETDDNNTIVNGTENKNNNKKENKTILRRNKPHRTVKESTKRVSIVEINDKAKLINNNNVDENNINIKIINNKNDEYNKQNSEKKVNHFNNNDNNKDEPKKDDKENNIKEELEKKERLKKSRGLRKILTKKSKEKKEVLRKYFHKFYLGGIYLSIRRGARKRTSEIRLKKRNRSVEYRRGTVILNELDLLNISMNKEEEDSESEKEQNRRNELLTKIFNRKDRIHILVMKKTLEKYNLRAKLMSLEQNRKGRNRSTNRSRKKGKHKSKSVSVTNLNELINEKNLQENF